VKRKPYTPPKLTPIDPGKGLACRACGHSSVKHSLTTDSTARRPAYACTECACANFTLRDLIG
jgi:hypothetical protein